MTNEKTLKALMDLDVATQALRQQLLRLGNVTNPFYVKLDGPQGKEKAWKRAFDGLTFDLEIFNKALEEYKSNYICHMGDIDLHALACEDAEDCEYGYEYEEGLYEKECTCIMKELHKMTKQEQIKQYEQAIKEAEATLDNPSAPIAAQDAAEKVIESLTQKINKLTVN